MRDYEKYEILKSQLGAEELLEQVIRMMSSDDVHYYMDAVANDIDVELWYPDWDFKEVD